MRKTQKAKLQGLRQEIRADLAEATAEEEIIQEAAEKAEEDFQEIPDLAADAGRVSEDIKKDARKKRNFSVIR